MVDGNMRCVFHHWQYGRLAALVPSPRVNLTRFHAVFAPNSHWRAPITRAGHGRERRSLRADQRPSAGEPHRARRRAQHLKRVFNFDIETCARCGAPIKIIASIEHPAVIKTILAHLDKTTSRMPARRVLPPAARAARALLSDLTDQAQHRVGAARMPGFH